MTIYAANHAVTGSFVRTRKTGSWWSIERRALGTTAPDRCSRRPVGESGDQRRTSSRVASATSRSQLDGAEGSRSTSKRIQRGALRARGKDNSRVVRNGQNWGQGESPRLSEH